MPFRFDSPRDRWSIEVPVVDGERFRAFSNGPVHRGKLMEARVLCIWVEFYRMNVAFIGPNIRQDLWVPKTPSAQLRRPSDTRG